MWPFGDRNPMASYFRSAGNIAANVPQTGEKGTYSAEMFLSDFPQFTKRDEDGNAGTDSLVPETILALFVEQANDSVLPSRWGSSWRYAAGLYVAHFSTLYLKTYAEGSVSAAQAAAGAEQTGSVKSVTMGDTAISYDSSAVTSGTEKWGAWNSTQYGLQLVTLARSVGMGGMYVI